MFINICKVCGAEVPCRTILHKHVKQEHSLKVEEYYVRYYDKRDLHTHEPITFKNVDFYLHTLFNNRRNLVTYFKNRPEDKSSLIKCLELRRELKNLTVAPSTTDCRSVILPTPLLCKTIGADYNEVCKAAGLMARFDYHQSLIFDTKTKLTISQDTREQKELKFPTAEVSETTMSIGDYTSKSHYKKIYFDRKSLTDFCGSMSQGFERVSRECERARESGYYLIFGIENVMADVEAIPFTPFIKDQIKATPEFLFSRMRELTNKFENVQFLFCAGRKELAAVMERVFRMENDIKSVDLQFMMDFKKLLV